MDVKQKFAEGVETTKLLTGLSQDDFALLKEAAPQARQWGAGLSKYFTIPFTRIIEPPPFFTQMNERSGKKP